MITLRKMHDLPTRSARRLLIVAAAFISLLISSCTQIQKPASEPFFAATEPPPKQEFRWSNGKMPKSFDPARAAAAPETDIVRAIFEGLTEIDSKSLDAVPAAAEKWTASDDKRIWTFQLRKDARWSNGKRVTADDFVISWKRLGTLGDKTAHRELIQNIVGLKTEKRESGPPSVEPTDFQHLSPRSGDTGSRIEPANPGGTVRYQESHLPQPSVIEPVNQHDGVVGSKQAEGVTEKKLGVEAVNVSTLKVMLDIPDKDFPKLVANPIFRPIYGDGAEFETDPLDADVVTNGGFTVNNVDKDGVTLNRSDAYWNQAAVKLDHVRFVPKDTAEAALDAYKKGEIDAVTNANFEPLALKLLSPYEDFRQTTHSALNFYEFNAHNVPFSDRRVREALAISIDRERLTDAEMEGSTQPAYVFLPLGTDHATKLAFDVEKARGLLEKAGFPNGTNFPPIRLLINRNDTQQRVARAVARMWKQNLNLETQIIVKEATEMEAAKPAGDYDLMRRGVVLPTADEMASLTAVFGSVVKSTEQPALEPKAGEIPLTQPPIKRAEKGGPSDSKTTEPDSERSPTITLLTEQDAMCEMNAIPLYFPMSYSLVKPYVKGFEMSGFGALSLRDVTIDSNWQPK